jgi:tRNA nucleotidyltransferase (CCA-adding enzyme)
MKTYLVGGAVRDMVMGKEPKDRDFVVVGATPAELINRGFRPVGRDFPVFLHPETQEEYALARQERSTGTRHTDFDVRFSTDVTLEEDLYRRDLTINAIALGEDGLYVDPYRGMQDVASKTLRHVSEAFSDDPLRVLRVARFMARYQPEGFAVAPETLALMRSLCQQGGLSHLSVERVWVETTKALMSPTPRAFFETLRDCDGLDDWFPELKALIGVPQPIKHHPEDCTFEHVMLCLEQAVRFDQPLEVRYATLVHDFGKGLTPTAQWPRHIGHEEAGVPLVEAFSQRLKVPAACSHLGRLVSEHHLRAHRALEMTPKSLYKLLVATDALRRPQPFDHFVAACEMDARGRLGLADRAYPQAGWLHAVRETALSVDTRTIVAQHQAKGGAAIGEAIARQRKLAIKSIRVSMPGAAQDMPC